MESPHRCVGSRGSRPLFRIVQDWSSLVFKWLGAHSVPLGGDRTAHVCGMATHATCSLVWFRFCFHPKKRQKSRYVAGIQLSSKGRDRLLPQHDAGGPKQGFAALDRGSQRLEQRSWKTPCRRTSLFRSTFANTQVAVGCHCFSASRDRSCKAGSGFRCVVVYGVWLRLSPVCVAAYNKLQAARYRVPLDRRLIHATRSVDFSGRVTDTFRLDSPP